MIRHLKVAAAFRLAHLVGLALFALDRVRLALERLEDRLLWGPEAPR